MPPCQVRAALRGLFAQWGLPERVRVDNGWPWGSSADLPPLLALWLIGLGVGVIHNPARSPQDNAKVERFHGLIEPWAEPENCPDFTTWQARLAWLSRVQRERYPSVGKQSRQEAFPDLATTVRPYVSEGETERWDFERVKDYLAQGLWVRRVDAIGRVNLYHHPYSVGRPYKGQQIYVRFDAQAAAWVFLDKAGNELRRRFAQEITLQTIEHLDVNYHRNHPAIDPCDIPI